MGDGDIIDVMKNVAAGVFNSSQPMKFIFGTVLKEKPLEVKVNDKMTLPASFLTLTRNVTDHTVSMKAPGDTAFKYYTVKNALKKGERVILLKNLNANGFIVLDRVVRAV